MIGISMTVRVFDSDDDNEIIEIVFHTYITKNILPIKAANRRRKKVVNAERKKESCGQVDRGIQQVFPLFHSDGQTGQQTDGWTDGQSLS